MNPLPSKTQLTLIFKCCQQSSTASTRLWLFSEAQVGGANYLYIPGLSGKVVHLRGRSSLMQKRLMQIRGDPTRLPITFLIHPKCPAQGAAPFLLIQMDKVELEKRTQKHFQVKYEINFVIFQA